MLRYTMIRQLSVSLILSIGRCSRSLVVLLPAGVAERFLHPFFSSVEKLSFLQLALMQFSPSAAVERGLEGTVHCFCVGSHPGGTFWNKPQINDDDYIIFALI